MNHIRMHKQTVHRNFHFYKDQRLIKLVSSEFEVTVN